MQTPYRSDHAGFVAKISGFTFRSQNMLCKRSAGNNSFKVSEKSDKAYFARTLGMLERLPDLLQIESQYIALQEGPQVTEEAFHLVEQVFFPNGDIQKILLPGCDVTQVSSTQSPYLIFCRNTPVSKTPFGLITILPKEAVDENQTKVLCHHLFTLKESHYQSIRMLPVVLHNGMIIVNVHADHGRPIDDIVGIYQSFQNPQVIFIGDFNRALKDTYNPGRFPIDKMILEEAHLSWYQATSLDKENKDSMIVHRDAVVVSEGLQLEGIETDTVLISW